MANVRFNQILVSHVDISRSTPEQSRTNEAKIQSMT